MSVGPMGMLGSIAGTPLSQARGTDGDRAGQEAAVQTRQSNSAEKAEAAAGVGQTEQDEQASDRDADGHRLWEQPPEAEQPEEEDSRQSDSSPSKDPSGERGANLDLNG